MSTPRTKPATPLSTAPSASATAKSPTCCDGTADVRCGSVHTNEGSAADRCRRLSFIVTDATTEPSSGPDRTAAAACKRVVQSLAAGPLWLRLGIARTSASVGLHLLRSEERR